VGLRRGAALGPRGASEGLSRDLISSGRQSSGCAFARGRLRFGLVSDRGAFGSIAHLPGVSHYRAPRPGKPPRNQRAAMSHLTPRGL